MLFQFGHAKDNQHHVWTHPFIPQIFSLVKMKQMVISYTA